MKRTLWLAAALLCATVQAQTVYRCGPDGRSYSQLPCAQGRVIEVNDERSGRQQQEAIDVAERDRALGDSLQQDRLAREARPRAGASSIDGRIGYARQGQAELAKTSAKSKKKETSSKAPRHAGRKTSGSAARKS